MISDVKEFCRLFHNTTFVPITYYNVSTNTTCSFPPILENRSLFNGPLPNFMHFTKNPDYFITESFSYFGYIGSSNDNSIIIIGPIFSTPVSEFTIHNFMKEWVISPNYKQDISQFLINTPQFSFGQFLQTLAYLHLCLNDESIDIARHFALADTSNINVLSSLHTMQMLESKESRNFHNTYHFERTLMQYIQNGELKKVKQILHSSATLTEGVLADNSLQQEKNIFISIVTLATRSAIAGGMDMEQAYQLSDIYIQECEKSQDIAYISNLSYSMLVDFTERVSKSKFPQGISQEVFNCIQFISCHTNESIQVRDVVEYVGKSRSYLTKKFKKELGSDISSFIMRYKLEEAKSLLTYSEKSLSEISNYLCFSSQAYFQNVFKKNYGITPAQYRIKSQQIQ